MFICGVVITNCVTANGTILMLNMIRVRLSSKQRHWFNCSSLTLLIMFTCVCAVVM